MKVDDRPQLLDWCAGGAFVVLLIAHNFVDGGDNAVVRTLGVAFLLLSPLLFVPPFVLLKKYGSADENGTFFDTNVTVDRGLYAVVRHPQYLGYMTLILGFVLLSQHWVTTAIGIAAIVFFCLHTVQEDRFCRKQLGEAYLLYSRRVPRFNIVAGMVRYVMTGRGRK
jgi:isoprenylcysteine carboxyl methyltransferase (ICMT) family protein YpbQ